MHAAIAFGYALIDDFERFKEYVVRFQGDLSPEQRSHLLAMGIDPDFDPGDESTAINRKPNVRWSALPHLADNWDRDQWVAIWTARTFDGCTTAEGNL
jgi:hypothetical protein